MDLFYNSLGLYCRGYKAHARKNLITHFMSRLEEKVFHYVAVKFCNNCCRNRRFVTLSWLTEETAVYSFAIW